MRECFRGVCFRNFMALALDIQYRTPVDFDGVRTAVYCNYSRRIVPLRFIPGILAATYGYAQILSSATSYLLVWCLIL